MTDVAQPGSGASDALAFLEARLCRTSSVFEVLCDLPRRERIAAIGQSPWDVEDAAREAVAGGFGREARVLLETHARRCPAGVLPDQWEAVLARGMAVVRGDGSP